MSKISGILNIIESFCYYMYVINITGSGYKIHVMKLLLNSELNH